MRWRNLRVTRWRTTDPPTDLPTTKPALAGTWVSQEWTWTTTVRVAARDPARITTRKSSARRILRRTGSTNGPTTRPRFGCDPCHGVQPARHALPGCSSGSGTRACGRADGCSAGTCASWRHPCGWEFWGEEPAPMCTTGRTDLFLGTKVRNSRRTGQTRTARRLLGLRAAPGSPPRSWGLHGTAGSPDHPVVGTPGNLWKTLARRRWAGIGSPGCPGWVSQDLGHARGKRDIRG